MKADVWRTASDNKGPHEDMSSHAETTGAILKNSILALAAQSNEHKQYVRIHQRSDTRRGTR